MNYKILQVLTILMSKTSFDRDGLNRFKPGGLNQGGQNLPTLGLDEWFWAMFEPTWTWPNFTFGQLFMWIGENNDQIGLPMG